MRAIIFANGSIHDHDSARALIQPEDTLIAADGGAMHCRRLGVQPDTIVGDLDSLPPAEVDYWRGKGVDFKRFDHRKDETDLELALLLAQDLEMDEAVVLGAFGNRWDHTFANVFLSAYHNLGHLNVTFWHDGMWLYLVRQTRQIHGQPGQIVSLLPLKGDAHGVSTEGLDYPLDDETLIFGASRGVSNVLLGQTAMVSLREGMLLCFVTDED